MTDITASRQRWSDSDSYGRLNALPRSRTCKESTASERRRKIDWLKATRRPTFCDHSFMERPSCRSCRSAYLFETRYDDDDDSIRMNPRRINPGAIVPRLPRPPQQTPPRWPLRVSRDHRHDVTDRPATVFGRRYNSAECNRTSALAAADRAKIQPRITAYRTPGFENEGTGCQRQRSSTVRNDVVTPFPVSNGHRDFIHPTGGKQLPVNSRVGQPKANCGQILAKRAISHTIAKPYVKGHNFRNVAKPEPEVEKSKPQRNGETSAHAENDDFVDGVAAVGDGCSTSRSSRDSMITSITWDNRDDTPQVRGRSARASGVFSRMSTEAQQAWIAVRQSAPSVASNDEPETKSPTHAADTTSGLPVQQTTTCNRVASRRHGAKYSTQETSYNVFAMGAATGNSASTYRVAVVPQHRTNVGHDSRAVGSFRITSAAYDSRFVDMALAASLQAMNNHVTGNNDDIYDDDDDDDDDVNEIRAESVAKCLLWLKTQHCQWQNNKQ